MQTFENNDVICNLTCHRWGYVLTLHFTPSIQVVHFQCFVVTAPWKYTWHSTTGHFLMIFNWWKHLQKGCHVQKTSFINVKLKCTVLLNKGCFCVDKALQIHNHILAWEVFFISTNWLCAHTFWICWKPSHNSVADWRALHVTTDVHVCLQCG